MATGSPTAVSGLASGINTASLVASLMAIARQPQDALKTKLGVLTTQITALQKINAQAASLATATQALSTGSTWTIGAATSSDPSVTATTNGAATTNGSITFTTVGALAAAHQVITGPVSGATPTAVSLTVGSSTYNGTALSGSAADIATAVNTLSTQNNLGMTAATAANGTRVLVTAGHTGASSVFSLTTGGTAGVGSTAATVVQQGADASITLANGTTTVTSSTNTFSGLLSGVDVSVSKLIAAPSSVTVSVAPNTAGITTQVSSMVDSLNTLLANAAFQTKAVPGSRGTAGAGSGPLVGEGTVTGLQQQLLSALTNAIGRDSAAAAGISVDQSGNATFDKTAFSNLLTSDPARAQRLVSALAGTLKTVATNASDPYSGSVSRLIKGDQSTSADLTNRIADWDTRLALRQSSLQAQYTAMETALSRLQSQSSALSAALANL